MKEYRVTVFYGDTKESFQVMADQFFVEDDRITFYNDGKFISSFPNKITVVRFVTEINQ